MAFQLWALIGKAFDFASFLTGKKFTISSIRVKKFCANSVYDTAIDNTSFIAPVPLEEAINQTIKHEFIEDHSKKAVLYSE